MDRQLALARVKVPAIGLVVVGALGVLNALLTMVGGVDEAKLEEAPSPWRWSRSKWSSS